MMKKRRFPGNKTGTGTGGPVPKAEACPVYRQERRTDIMNYHQYQFSVPQEKMVRVITDTDAKNEADDQFAIVQALLSPKFENVGLIAAHFGTDRVPDSMERSYRELQTIFEKMDLPSRDMLYKGAPHAMERDDLPVESEGARLIVREAMKADPRPLYVLFLGPLTDLASAYLVEPRIAGRLCAIWIGGGRYPDGGPEYNLGNDITAARVVFASNMELWQVPQDVYQMMTVSLAELEYRVRPCGKIGAYLCDQLEAHSHEPGPRTSPFRAGEAWVLGDNPAVGLLLYGHRYDYDCVPAPQITADGRYLHTGLSRKIRVYNRVDNRFILEDLYAKLALFSRNQASCQTHP